jgi:arylsulfatase A-like enzyme
MRLSRQRVIRRSAAVLGLALGAVALASVASSLHRKPPPTAVVIVTLDTARADRLSPYGFMNAAMPGLERLAREGVLFDQAMTASPLTLPSHCTLFTGLLPPRHGVRDNADSPLAPAATTMAELLSGSGYRTAAFVAAAVLDPDRGLSQGFDVYRSAPTGDGARAHRRERRGDEVMTEALDWLAGAGRSPFFLWVHLYDPHRPYDPPEPFRSRHVDPYIGELAFADAQIGRLLSALDTLKLRDRTIVVVAGDHGESLGDHGERDHGIFVYQSVLRVPLIVRVPDVAPRRIGSVVRLADVLPTVLEVLDIRRPRGDGVSLLAMMQGRQPPVDREAYAESLYPQRFAWSPLRAIRDGRFKFIDAPRPELYDLETDPFEERNLYDRRRPLAHVMGGRIDALDDSNNPRPSRGSEPPASVRQRLAALGYVGTGNIGSSRPPQALPDPKDCIGHVNSVSDVSAPDGSGTSPSCR